MRTYVIAEAGCNHNGSVDTAKIMIEKATIAGADAVKFQTFWNLGCLKEYEFTKDQWACLKDYCDKMGTDFLTTPHWGSPLCGYKDEDYEVIDFVDTLVERHKIASPYVTNEKYVRYIASKGKPVLMSTGSLTEAGSMATDKQIEQALVWLDGIDTTLLHCVSQYPPVNAHYERIKELRYFGHKVGISDHTQKLLFPPMDVIEKHFKLDDNCIDAKISITPKQLHQMVEALRNFEESKIYEET